jgi:hypothetical protein
MCVRNWRTLLDDDDDIDIDHVKRIASDLARRKPYLVRSEGLRTRQGRQERLELRRRS